MKPAELQARVENIIGVFAERASIGIGQYNVRALQALAADRDRALAEVRELFREKAGGHTSDRP